MLYYRVKPEYDNKPRYKKNSRGKLVMDSILVANELYTLKEFEKLERVCLDWFEKVNIKKTDTYFFFGARFGD
jgi:hypothetical protein